MTSHLYNRIYAPPIPTLEISLRHPDGERLAPMEAILDTGADATLIPSVILESLKLESYDDGFLRSQRGERRSIEIYILDIQIGDVTLPGVEVVGDDIGDEIILGRNSLNKLIMLLDGPAQRIDVLLRRPRLP